MLKDWQAPGASAELQVIEQILAVASAAPLGLPPSEVSVLVLEGTNKVAALRPGLIEQLPALAVQPAQASADAPFFQNGA